MNFYAQQERARRATTLLVVLFFLATICVVIAANMVGIFFAMALDTRASSQTLIEWARARPVVVLWFSLGTAMFIMATSAVKILEFRKGGRSVADALGARWLSSSTSDQSCRRLYNVVEEISIAVGIPTPQIYVLEHEYGINAFAAGFSSTDAVIVVTRSTIELLDRDELQGVIAHEFSHILNGDTRLNMHMIGVLYGLTAVSEWGWMILRSGARTLESVRVGRQDGRAAGLFGIVAVAGISLIVIGWIGGLFGYLIKAAVLRQRELLADASAVQFTRNPLGIAGALKKIAAWRWGSRIYAANSRQINHMLIANGHHPWEFWFSSHPPLESRIRAIDHHFTPAELPSLAEKLNHAYASLGPRFVVSADDAPSASASGLASGAVLNAVQTAVAVAPMTALPLQDAAKLRALIPASILDAAHSKDEAVAVILGLVLSRSPKMRALQVAMVENRIGPAASARVDALGYEIAALEPAFRLPLFNVAFSAVKNRPHAQIRALVRLIDEMGRADGEIDIFEYLMTTVVRDYLHKSDRPRFNDGNLRLIDVRAELRDLISIVAKFGHGNRGDTQHAYEQGMRKLFPVNMPGFLAPDDWTSALDRALSRLDWLRPTGKKALFEALTTTISQDGKITVGEAGLVHAVCELLHCPFPVSERLKNGIDRDVLAKSLPR